ncbi:MAG: MarR family transcriptional regulator [Tistrella sp.]|jgi:DNA-binding MarR family transcriptional regulator|uniref:MarR family transcriptional regulator n=1 Tax=Tistrella mobilis TaxID=171437 RepID=A0A161QZE4_9PROT|nr:MULTISPECIES: MarR family transcriptional regulator [Tistrella]KYO50193.1 MarR family transcriptional regulator [Tistrella mobilis]MAD36672.1 MarR family transcriptional regulator [Tistrella sp.]MBA75779.1 MarR family transcriptional regulator [Tistrella sp.]HAE46394.1 MarR family transcriptional regulator [Tistrella mobilis]|tara:strand:- start:147 stop:614 length:468 start_codon:yes stop_codon:yes gene_type:complete
MADDINDPLRLDAQLCFALYGASLAMTKLYRPVLEGLGLTYPQYLAMLVLWESDDVTVGDLGRRLGLDSGTLTPLLKRLEAAGLVTRRRDPRDERQVRVALTEAGRALKARARHVPERMFCAMGLELDELGDLRRRLHALQARLSDAAAEPDSGS